MFNASRCSQNETRSSAQKPVLVSVPVAVLPVFCMHHTVCAVEVCLASALFHSWSLFAAWFYTSTAPRGPGDCSAPSVYPSMSHVSE